ncbi:acylphosphatase [Patescibacteria group bacterium]|nr:acylphosphatase [Patescibacteria group bacterium]MBU1895257.1 acylphosphatase [Patescibacteria group bacterium]
MKRLSVKIHGKVQGVFFRVKIQEKANSLGLVGWVRNAEDGTVELLAEGKSGDLMKLLEFCKDGPEHALVEKVEDSWKEINILSFEGFEINYT